MQSQEDKDLRNYEIKKFRNQRDDSLEDERLKVWKFKSQGDQKLGRKKNLKLLSLEVRLFRSQEVKKVGSLEVRKSENQMLRS